MFKPFGTTIKDPIADGIDDETILETA